MTKKLSTIRFKPKPEHYEQFLADVIENGKDRNSNTHFTVTTADEVSLEMQMGLNKAHRTAWLTG